MKSHKSVLSFIKAGEWHQQQIEELSSIVLKHILGNEKCLQSSCPLGPLGSASQASSKSRAWTWPIERWGCCGCEHNGDLVIIMIHAWIQSRSHVQPEDRKHTLRTFQCVRLYSTCSEVRLGLLHKLHWNDGWFLMYSQRIWCRCRLSS
jgi:hypothetical protein